MCRPVFTPNWTLNYWNWISVVCVCVSIADNVCAGIRWYYYELYRMERRQFYHFFFLFFIIIFILFLAVCRMRRGSISKQWMLCSKMKTAKMLRLCKHHKSLALFLLCVLIRYDFMELLFVFFFCFWTILSLLQQGTGPVSHTHGAIVVCVALSVCVWVFGWILLQSNSWVWFNFATDDNNDRIVKHRTRRLHESNCTIDAIDLQLSDWNTSIHTRYDDFISFLLLV